ncbi:MAG TPA: two-component regulator propeller domain-containing protein [Roseiflexaceae bacterium]|nr:two-component regulator propeller domain-containing protein [Roseiflexaceae bacterium]
MRHPHRGLSARALAHTLLLLTSLALLSACGGATTQTPTAVPTAAAEPTDAPEPTAAEPTDAPEPTAAAEPTDAPEPTDAAEPTAATGATAAPSGDIGTGTLVALGVGDGRVSVLKDSAWLTPEVEENLDGCLGSASVLAGADGTLWASCFDLARSTDGGATWSTVPGDRELGKTSLLDSQGQIWWITDELITVLSPSDGSVTASYTASEATGEEGFPTETAAFAKDGTLWLGGLNVQGSELVSFDGTAWKAYGENEALGVQSFESPQALHPASDGRMLVATSSGLYEIKDGKLSGLIPESLALDFPSTVTSVAELPDGKLALASFGGVTLWDGTQLEELDGLPSEKVNAVAVDAAGRLWAATDNGIAVRDAEGAWLAASPSTSGLADSRISGLLVIGAPSLPAPVGTPKTAGLSGRMLQGGTPAANLTVQLCSESGKSFFNDNPCEDMGVVLKATTDADGNFAFTEVPIGTHSLVAQKADGQWVTFLGGIPVLDPGQEVQLGDVKLDS